MTPKTVTTSIVVPCRNEEDTIESCVRSLMENKGPPVEIVVVDDGSTDGTTKIVERYARENLVKHIRMSERKGTIAAINTGIKRASGEVVGVLAGDSRAEKDWIRTALQHFTKEPDVIAVGGPLLSLQPTYLGRCGELLDSLLLDIGAEIPSLPGTNMLIRSNILRRVGFFDESLGIGEDLDMSIRLKKYAKEHGGRIVFDAKLKVYTAYPESIGEVVKRHFWWGMGRGRAVLRRGEALRLATLGRILYAPLWVVLGLLFSAAISQTGMLLLGLGGLFVLASLFPAATIATALAKHVTEGTRGFKLSEVPGVFLLAYLRLVSGSIGSIWAFVRAGS